MVDFAVGVDEDCVFFWRLLVYPGRTVGMVKVLQQGTDNIRSGR